MVAVRVVSINLCKIDNPGIIRQQKGKALNQRLTQGDLSAPALGWHLESSLQSQELVADSFSFISRSLAQVLGHVSMSC